MFWNLVYPENLLASIVLAILGAACAYSLTELSGQSNGLWHSCEVNRYVCINSVAIFQQVERADSLGMAGGLG